MMRLPRSLLGRTVLLTCSVAAAVVLVAAVTAYPLIRSAVITREQALLSRVADLTAAALEMNGASATIVLPQTLQRRLVEGQVAGYILTSAAAPPVGMSRAQAQSVLNGSQVSGVGLSVGGPVLVEGRPLAPGLALVLVQPIDVILPVARQALLQVAAALLVGLAVALVLGVLAARRLARPLAAVRQAAHRMAAGERDVRLPARGPVEVRDIAEALNQLDAALMTSEGRQRDFLLSISHELRTPLTGIRGYAEAMADGLIPAEDLARTGARVSAEADRLARLIDDLLVLARLEAMDFPVTVTRVDLVDLVGEAVDAWQGPCTAAGSTLAWSPPLSPLMVWTDPIRVRQLLDNLVENAVRISSAGSAITVALSSPEPSSGPEPDVVTLQVDDEGPGLSSADLGRAFEPGALYEAYRGVRPVGTGLGLAIVGRLSRRLGGSASAHARPTGGASFRVHLPLGEPSPILANTRRDTP